MAERGEQLEIGSILKEAREKKGYTLKEVENKIKIRAKYLDALEREEFNILPGRVYAKAFLRTYAKFLELDEGNLVALYNEKFPPETIQELPDEKVWHEPKNKKSASKLLTYLLAIVTIAGILIYFNTYKNSVGPGDNERQNIVQNGVSTGENVDHDKGEGNNASKVDQSDTGTGVRDENGTETRAGFEDGDLPHNGVEVILNVKDRKCWVRAIVDGQRLLEETIPPGETLQFTGEEVIEIRLGDPSAVEVIHNGKNLGRLSNNATPITQTFYPKNETGDET